MVLDVTHGASGFHAHLVLCDAASPGGPAVMRLPGQEPGPESACLVTYGAYCTFLVGRCGPTTHWCLSRHPDLRSGNPRADARVMVYFYCYSPSG